MSSMSTLSGAVLKNMLTGFTNGNSAASNDETEDTAISEVFAGICSGEIEINVAASPKPIITEQSAAAPVPLMLQQAATEPAQNVRTRRAAVPLPARRVGQQRVRQRRAVVPPPPCSNRRAPRKCPSFGTCPSCRVLNNYVVAFKAAFRQRPAGAPAITPLAFAQGVAALVPGMLAVEECAFPVARYPNRVVNIGPQILLVRPAAAGLADPSTYRVESDKYNKIVSIARA